MSKKNRVIPLIPGPLVFMCMMSAMRCYTVMQPFVYALSGLGILFGILHMVLLLKQEEV